MLILLGLVLLLILAVMIYLRHPRFGRVPDGERLERLQQSPQFREGKFDNLEPTPQLVEGYTIRGVLLSQLFKKAPHRRPKGLIPSVKTDLRALPLDRDVMVWFGHSSYLVVMDGKKILVDPVLSDNASPIYRTNIAFRGSDVYRPQDIPAIDYLLITHDHYDHLDYATIRALKDRVSTVVCGLGVGAHLEYWGFRPEQIRELDWHESMRLDENLTLRAAPARHFSGRGFTRNNTLWISAILQGSKQRIYLGGDSGYGSHFQTIGQQYGPFDLVILDNGQYNDAWRPIHAFPEDVQQAAKDLRAKRLFPAHSGKFALANHNWYEPLQRITEANKGTGISLVTPLIGQVVELDNQQQMFDQWWSKVD